MGRYMYLGRTQPQQLPAGLQERSACWVELFKPRAQNGRFSLPKSEQFHLILEQLWKKLKIINECKCNIIKQINKFIIVKMYGFKKKVKLKFKITHTGTINSVSNTLNELKQKKR